MRAAVVCAVLCLGLASPALAIDRVVGVTAPNGGVTLVKQIHVTPGTEVAGVEIVSNDPSTVFPALRLRRMGEQPGTRGAILCEVTDVAPIGGTGHRFTVTLPHTVSMEDADVLVEVVLPPTPGVEVVGVGAGLGALDLGGSPASSYIGYEATGELQAIDADLCVVLVGGAAAGKANPGLASAGTPPSGGLTPPSVDLGLWVHTPIGGEAEVRLAAPNRVAVAVEVYDVRGKVVRMLFQGELPAGEHLLAWNRRDGSGHAVASGVYFVVARVAGREVTRKTVVLR